MPTATTPAYRQTATTTTGGHYPTRKSFGQFPREKTRMVIKRDSYAFQAYARMEVMRPTGWVEVAYIAGIEVMDLSDEAVEDRLISEARALLYTGI